jgi:hypothetical protein
MSNSIFNQTGLIVNPSTNRDKELLQNFFNNSDFYAEYNSEFNCFVIEEGEDHIDALEMHLTDVFNDMGISASFESNIV